MSQQQQQTQEECDTKQQHCEPQQKHCEPQQKHCEPQQKHCEPPQKHCEPPQKHCEPPTCGGLPGGLGEQRPAGDEERDIVKQMKEAVEAKTNKDYACFEAVAVRIQVVAGTIFFIKVKVGGQEKKGGCVEYIIIKVFRPLPRKGCQESLELQGVQEHKSECDEIEFF